ncbi:MAG: hypothetical protein M1827_002688 [Pycnora praestabilis]|nr:MAG: hypothetical protein M1827_002688 [Pycnora praestabilis]
MAEPEVQIFEGTSTEETPSNEVDMAGAEATEADTGAGENGENGAAAEEEEVIPSKTTFIDYLKSPIVELLVGAGEDQTLLTAHQALLIQSPFFKEACANFSDNASRRRIELMDDQLDAVGCFLQYLYTGEYFPRRLDETQGLEPDPSVPETDDSGEQLLKHARVYTLGDKLGLKNLQTLARSKIHCVNSTARAEIVYARFVYAHTPSSDTVLRKPVASFWAMRSHVLRHEAEPEFRQMCLEYPMFGYDVLSLVLDHKESKGRDRPERVEGGVGASGRKRQRISQA